MISGRLAIGLLAGAGLLLGLGVAIAHASAPTGGPKGATFLVDGKSGRKWVAEMLPSSDNVRLVDVWAMLEPGTRPAATLANGEAAPASGSPGAGGLQWWRIARYRQLGADMNTRRLVGTPWPADTPLLRAALTDFGVQS